MRRVKFHVRQIGRTMAMRGRRDPAGGDNIWETVEMQTVVLFPVSSQDLARENWGGSWQVVPGEIRLESIDQEAWSDFKIDREYYVRFDPVE